MPQPARSAEKVVAALGCGCLALVLIACCGGLGGLGGLWRWSQSEYDQRAVVYASELLSRLRAHDLAGAYAAARSGADPDYEEQGRRFEACLAATPLADLTSFVCSETAGAVLAQDGVDVECAVTSATRGETTLTMHVNAPDDPSLGFIWFGADAQLGEAWHADDCATWSGKRFVGEPPSGRVRP